MSRSSSLRTTVVTLALSTLLFACQWPLAPSGPVKGKLNLSFAPPSGRTVVPDLHPLLAAIDSIDLKIQSNLPASLPQFVTVTGVGAASIIDLEAGTYTIDATAYKSASPIAYGKQLTLGISAGEVRSETIVLAPSLITGTGDLNLKVTYPATAGVTAVTATLKARGIDKTQDFGPRNLTITTVGARNEVTVVQAGLPAGAYDLELVFTENGSPRTYQQAVNIFQDQTADHVVDGAGSLESEWALSEEYFGSSTFLADVVFTTTDTTNVPSGTIEGQGFSSPTRNYNLVTKASSYRLTATVAYTGQTIEFWDSGAATPVWVPLSSDVTTNDFDMDAKTTYQTLNLRVSSPGGARGYYTFHLVRAGGAGVTTVVAPVVSVITPNWGQPTWAQNETVTANATASTTGTWAWYFDALPVAGQTTSSFSAAASSLSTTLGNHLLTVLFTDGHGFTWTQTTALQFIDAADVVVSIKAKKTRVNMTGAKAWVYNTADVDQAEELSINFADSYIDKVWYGIDTFATKTALTYGTDYTTSFSISGIGLSPGFHTLMLQVLLRDNTLAGVLVPFEVKARDAGSALSPFVVALADRYFPTVYADSTPTPWKSQWYAESVSSIDFTVQIPLLDAANQSALLRYSLAGQQYSTPINSGEAKDLSILLADFADGLPPGPYPLVLELWAGPSPGERRNVGTLTVLVQFLGGTNDPL